MSGMNAIEKILADHSEQDVVRPGDGVMVDVDVTVQFDAARSDGPQGPRPPLKVAAVSGSALPGGLATRFMDAYGDVLYNLYGSTEASWASIATPAELRRAQSARGTHEYHAARHKQSPTRRNR